MFTSVALQSNPNLINQVQNKSKQGIYNNKNTDITEASPSGATNTPHATTASNVRTIYQKANFSTPGNFDILQVLGKGSYGTVVSAIDKQVGRKPRRLAIKKVTNIFAREILLKRAIRELKFLNFFRGHKNIVSIVDLEIVTEKPYDGLYCYQELVEYDLARVIHSTVQFSEFHIRHFLYQILCGLKYIHSAEVVHRDLKPGNILCSINGTLKICDFGLARGIAQRHFGAKGAELSITNYVATRWYRAPELILSRKKYTKSIDMWAVGCILAEFYGRKPIFMGQDSLHQISEILEVLGTPSRLIIAKYCSTRSWEIFSMRNETKKRNWSSVYPYSSDYAQDLLDTLLDWDPDARPTAETALEHIFFADLRNPKEEPICPHGTFDFSYENNFTSMAALRECLYDEVKAFKQQV
ncbi:LAQU0S12e01948g1_1 [Lachancea quebecensis]|uniref:LAQU0S12e01948g1_1 n=1 Tax=Lachancea quebecensis TaxID=1654605 RepID=A0A0P1KX16_9SACH|nr:LAQU0S12e01948g1_1 [Lachancea quebecensis]